jgi:MFS family permease
MLTTGVFSSRWWMVAAAALGLTLNTGVVQNFAFAVFIKPITEDLEITRATLMSGLVFASVLGTFVAPCFGKAIDYFGLRVVHIPMIAAFAATTALLSLLRTPYSIMVLFFVLHGCFGAAQSPVAYSKAITASFDKDRGLALGIAIAGVGLGVAIIPPFANYLIIHYGWRVAYLGMGAAIVIMALVPVTLFLREPPLPPERVKVRDGHVGPGIAFSEAVLRGWRFWAMTVAFFMTIVAVNGTLTQVVALLTDRGEPLARAVLALSLSGLALTVGRIVSGFCLDRVHGPYVATFFFVCAGIGVALLAGDFEPISGTMLCGLGIGAEVDLMAYFVSRYFGLRSFGAIYGLMFALFSLGVGVGPWLMALSHDRLNSYVPMMTVFEVGLAVSCALLLCLGPYRFATGDAGTAADEPAHGG